MVVMEQRVDRSMGETGGQRRFVPLFVAEAYLSFTVFVFAFGPLPWDVRNPFTLYAYLFLVQLALFIGYWSKAKERSVPVYVGHSSREKMLRISTILSLIAIVPFYYIQLGRLEFSLSGIIGQIALGVTNPGEAYKEILSASGPGSHFFLMWLYVLVSPILWICVPLAVSLWETLPFKMKMAVAFIVSANILTWVAVGTIQGVADNFAIIALCMLVSGRRVRFKRHGLRRAIAVAAALAIVVFYFSYAQNSRARGKLNVAIDPSVGIALDPNNFMVVALPPEAQSAVGRASSYLTQGYYALSLALSLPFEWTFGVGHSPFWTAVLNHFTGIDVTDQTYPARVEDQFGWSMQHSWDSAYTWLASDLTFPGAILLMIVVGRLLASTWFDTQAGESPYAPALFILLMLNILYLPANTKMLSSVYSVGAFWGLLGLWAATHRTSNVPRFPLANS